MGQRWWPVTPGVPAAGRRAIPAVEPIAGPSSARAYPKGALCIACKRVPPRSHWLCLACWRRWKRTGTTAQQPLTTLDLVDPMLAAWCAGVFEGEGTIGIRPRNTRSWGRLVVSITNGQLDLLQPFHARWEGNIAHWPSKPPVCAYHRWSTGARMGAAFLQDIQPYIRSLKYQERIALALEFQAQKALGSHKNHDPAYQREQDEYVDKMRKLNKRGTS